MTWRDGCRDRVSCDTCGHILWQDEQFEDAGWDSIYTSFHYYLTQDEVEGEREVEVCPRCGNSIDEGSVRAVDV